MTDEESSVQWETRRHFFGRCGVGLGAIALASLLADGALAAGTKPVNPLAPKPGHFPAKVKSVIYLFMAGGPSQLELFDYKPALQKYDGQPAPESLLKGKRFAFMDTFAKEPPKLLGSRREFRQYGKSGLYMSDLLPNIGTVADDDFAAHGAFHRQLQPRPREVLRQHGIDSLWPPEHRRLGHVRNRERVRRDFPDSSCCSPDRGDRGAARRCGAAASFPLRTRACRSARAAIRSSICRVPRASPRTPSGRHWMRFAI